MSKGPTHYKPFETKSYLHLKLTPKDWCTYTGLCRIEQLAVQNGECNCCQYKMKMDIPAILEKLNNGKECEMV